MEVFDDDSNTLHLISMTTEEGDGDKDMIDSYPTTSSSHLITTQQQPPNNSSVEDVDLFTMETAESSHPDQELTEEHTCVHFQQKLCQYLGDGGRVYQTTRYECISCNQMYTQEELDKLVEERHKLQDDNVLGEDGEDLVGEEDSHGHVLNLELHDMNETQPTSFVVTTTTSTNQNSSFINTDESTNEIDPTQQVVMDSSIQEIVSMESDETKYLIGQPRVATIMQYNQMFTNDTSDVKLNELEKQLRAPTMHQNSGEFYATATEEQQDVSDNIVSELSEDSLQISEINRYFEEVENRDYEETSTVDIGKSSDSVASVIDGTDSAGLVHPVTDSTLTSDTGPVVMTTDTVSELEQNIRNIKNEENGDINEELDGRTDEGTGTLTDEISVTEDNLEELSTAVESNILVTFSTDKPNTSVTPSTGAQSIQTTSQTKHMTRSQQKALDRLITELEHASKDNSQTRVLYIESAGEAAEEVNNEDKGKDDNSTRVIDLARPTKGNGQLQNVTSNDGHISQDIELTQDSGITHDGNYTQEKQLPQCSDKDLTHSSDLPNDKQLSDIDGLRQGGGSDLPSDKQLSNIDGVTQGAGSETDEDIVDGVTQGAGSETDEDIIDGVTQGAGSETDEDIVEGFCDIDEDTITLEEDVDGQINKETRNRMNKMFEAVDNAKSYMNLYDQVEEKGILPALNIATTHITNTTQGQLKTEPTCSQSGQQKQSQQWQQVLLNLDKESTNKPPMAARLVYVKKEAPPGVCENTANRMQGTIPRIQSTVVGNQGRVTGNQGVVVSNRRAVVGNQGIVVGKQGKVIGYQGSVVSNQRAVIGNQGAVVGNQGAVIGNQGTAIGNRIELMNKATLYQCLHCKVAFTSVLTLEKHYIQVHKGDVSIHDGYKRTMLNKETESNKRNKATVNLIKINGENIYLCRCNARFKTMASLEEHLNTVDHSSPMTQYECTDCDRSFNTYQALNAHMISHSSKYVDKMNNKRPTILIPVEPYMTRGQDNEEEQKVEAVSRKLFTAENVNIGQNVPTDGVSLEPVVSYQEVTTQQLPSMHIHQEVGSDGELIINYESSSDVHQTMVDPVPEVTPGINVEESVTLGSSRDNHGNNDSEDKPMKEVSDAVILEGACLVDNVAKYGKIHRDSRTQIEKDILSITCIRCNKSYSCKEQFTYTGTLQCTACRWNFESPPHLQCHYDHFHKYDRECPICGLNLTRCSSTVMDKHYKTMHPDKDIFHCYLCEATFTTRACLRNHVTRHFSQTGDHECPHCHMRFEREQRLNVHKVRNHSKLLGYPSNIETPDTPTLYMCGICGRQYEYEGTLRLHLRKHQINVQNDDVMGT